jgi:hypothetical protein
LIYPTKTPENHTINNQFFNLTQPTPTETGEINQLSKPIQQLKKIPPFFHTHIVPPKNTFTKSLKIQQYPCD